MNYFIGQNLGDRLTGIEKAQLNRLKLFESKKLKAKRVYTEYSGRLHEHTTRFGATDNCFTMYDFFR